MTYNIGRIKKDPTKFPSVLSVIRSVAPDILGIQEATVIEDMDGWQFNQPEQIANVLGHNGNNFYFGPTISLKEHFHATKQLFVDGLFNDWSNWWQGNAIFSRYSFVRFGNEQSKGVPWNLSIYHPKYYEGNRDTDPRNVIFSRIDYAPLYPYILVTHLTTLVGERGGNQKEISGKQFEAQQIRSEQCLRICNLLEDHVIKQKKVVFLMGDFNAPSYEECIGKILIEKGEFLPLEPTKIIPTHPKVSSPVDHIFVYPGDYHINYKCSILDTEDTRNASDHLPVVAEIDFFK